MLTGLHFLLTYQCTSECDHCFVFSGPNSKGTFTINSIRDALDQARDLRTIEWIYFEGGEPFLYYALMLKGMELALDRGFKVGVVTNAYFATTEEDAAIWLAPLKEFGISDLAISDDAFHSEYKPTPAWFALAAARKLGLPAGSICIEPPKPATSGAHVKGAPIVGGGVMFRGRATVKLAPGLPTRGWDEFDECPHEELRNPERVHIDPYGNIHLCQGLCMGNAWQTPLPELVAKYDPDTHPIVGPLLRGGPAQLVREYDLARDGSIDACHLCFRSRLALIDRFPEYLAPRQVYGIN
jgi:hypothetical protein